MLHIFIGYDHRQPISYNVCQYSIIQRASKPVAISPIKIDTLGLGNLEAGPWLKGLTPFTHTRWLTPYLAQDCAAEIAVFMDADILVRGDIHELVDGLDWGGDLSSAKSRAIYVHKNKEVFEWPSVMVFNCRHPANQVITPQSMASGHVRPYKWDWVGGSDSELIGDFPADWNHLVGYDEPNADAKLVHFTAGIPAFPETQMSEHSEAWHQSAQSMASALPWKELMGFSVHARWLLNGKIVPPGTPGAEPLPIVHPDVQGAEEGEPPQVDMSPLQGLVA